MLNEIKDIIESTELEKTKKYLTILTQVNLLSLEKSFVEDKFKRVYLMLIYDEDYVTCAKLHKIEEKYYQDLKKDNQ